MIQPQNPRSKQPQPGRVRQGPGDADGPLEAVPGLEDGVVGPLLAGGDDLDEGGVRGAPAEPPDLPEVDLAAVPGLAAV